MDSMKYRFMRGAVSPQDLVLSVGMANNKVMTGDGNRRISTALVFFCNGKRVTVKDVDPETTLLTFLRSNLHLKGTKNGCEQGACGACTVMVSKYYPLTKKIRHWSATACLTPLCSLHGLAVTTVEGIGSTKDKLHPVQERIAIAHGSQCGFCTPGFVMSMYTLLRNNPTPSMEEIKWQLEGNLCRCTGYRPILDAYKSFTQQGCSGRRTDGVCCQVKTQLETGDENLGVSLFDISDFTPYDPSQDIIFPPELLISAAQSGVPVTFVGERVTWHSPSTLPELLSLKAANHDAKIVAGFTSLGLYLKKMKDPLLTLISCTLITELQEIKVVDGGFQVGAAVSLNDLEKFMRKQIETLPEDKSEACSAFVDILEQYSSKQIKNVATIGGHVASTWRGSDLNPLLLAAGAVVHLKSSKYTRQVNIDKNFFQEKTQIAIHAEEVISGVFIPFMKKNEFLRVYKQMDGTIKAGFRVRLSDGAAIEDLCIAVGGMTPVYRIAQSTQETLRSRVWSKDLIEIASDALMKEFASPPGVTGETKAYQQAIPSSLFFKFFIYVSSKLSLELKNSLRVPESWITGGQGLTSGQFKSSQVYQKPSPDKPLLDSVGEPMVFKSAFLQASGEALYVDDIPAYPDELSLGLVFSQKPHAKILAIDFSDAIALSGVYDILTANDVPGTNFIDGEMLFANEKVLHVGQVIAGVIAESGTIARRAASLVKVEYEELEAVLSIQDAISNSNYHTSPLTLQNGDVTSGFELSDCVFEGEVGTSAQEHMYMEPHVAVAIPKGEHGEMEIAASCQFLSGSQEVAAKALGVSQNRVVARCKRVGGAFGGKFEVAPRLSAMAAVAARKTNRPIRLVLSREEDMQLTGTRHPYLAKYKVGCTKDGKIMSVDLQIWSNAGYKLGISDRVMVASSMNCNVSYKIPNMNFTGHICKTNLPLGTALRGFGQVQMQAITETWITHLAQVTGLPQKQVRETNLLQEGDQTPTNQPVTGALKRCWNECLKQSNYDDRLKQVQKFNSESRWIKRGVAINPSKFIIGHFHPVFQIICQAGALVNIYTDGSVLITHNGIEYGQGLYTKTVQVTSRCLGVPVEKIHISETSTDKIPNQAETGQSFTTDLVGFALKNACDILSDRLSPFKKANPDGSWENWVKAAFIARVNLSATGFYSPKDMTYNQKTNEGQARCYFSYGTAVCEVEVDCLTGSHKLLRTDIVMDVGKSMNPAVDVGQIEGGFIQGYGMFTLEDHRWSSESGHYLEKGPGPYKVPAVSNIFGEMKVSLLPNSTEPRAIFSSKGIGEPPLVLGSTALCAIWNAVSTARADAGFNDHFTLNVPAVPEQVRLACKDDITQQCCTAGTDSVKPAFYRR